MAFEGNTISIIDVDIARSNDPAMISEPGKGEVARIRVGTSNPDVQTRPFIPSFTPDGKRIVVPNFRSNNVSIVSLEKALGKNCADGANVKSGCDAEIARIPLTRLADPDGVVRASRPKGSAVTPDGRFAVISAGPRTTFVPSGTVSVIDLRTFTVVATVTGVGNDPYGLAVVDVKDD